MEPVVTDAGRTPARGGGAPYGDVLRLPGVGGVTAVALAARIPATAVGVTMTLHMVLTLGHGFAAAGLVAAGLVAAAIPTGMAIGGPVLGSLVDRRGLRPMLLLTMLASAGFWARCWRRPCPPGTGARRSQWTRCRSSCRT